MHFGFAELTVILCIQNQYSFAMSFEGSFNFPSESIKIIGESIGIQGLADEVAKETSEDITFRLKNIIQVLKYFLI